MSNELPSGNDTNNTKSEKTPLITGETPSTVTKKSETERKAIREELDIGNDKLKEDIESMENNELLIKLHSMMDSYFDSKLEGLEIKNTDTIKLVLWNQFQSKMSIGGFIGKFTEEISSKFTSIYNIFNSEGKEKNSEGEKESLVKIMDKISESIESDDKNNDKMSQVFAKYFNIDESIENLKQNKTGLNISDNDLNNPYIVKLILDKNDVTKEEIETTKLNKDRQKYYEGVKNQTIELGKKLEGGKNSLNDVVKLFESVPDPIKDKISSFINNIFEKFPFLETLVGFFLGKDFLSDILSGESKHKKESIKNLFTYSKTDDSVLKGFIGEDDLKNITPESLSAFYKYLKKNEIDYKQEGFWEKIISGKKATGKLEKVHNLLRYNLDKNSPTFSSDDFGKQKSKGFLDRLNGLKLVEEDIQRKQDLADLKKRQTEKESKIKAEAEADTENKKKLEKEKELLDIEEAFSDIKKLPLKITYNKKEYSLNIVDNNLVISDTSDTSDKSKQKYQISLIGKGIEVFKEIRLDKKSGTIVIDWSYRMLFLSDSGSQKLNAKQLKIAFLGLIDNGSYESKVPKEEPKADLKITKIA